MRIFNITARAILKIIEDNPQNSIRDDNL